MAYYCSWRFGASQLDDSNLNVTTSSSTPSSSSTTSISRQKSSPIWQYCRIEYGKCNPAAWVDSDGRKWWHCQPCFGKKREKYSRSGGSSTIIDHLRKEHRIIKVVHPPGSDTNPSGRHRWLHDQRNSCPRQETQDDSRGR